MGTYLFDIGPKERAIVRFHSHVTQEFQRAYVIAAKEGMTLQKLANAMGVPRKESNRMLSGARIMTLRETALMANALGCEISFRLGAPEISPEPDFSGDEAPGSAVKR